MSTTTVLPSLTNWTKSHITAIFQARSAASFSNAFDAFVSKDVHVTLNGRHVSREQYKQHLQAENFEQGASVQFNGTVEVPSDQDRPANAGTVGVFFEADVAKRFNIFGARAESIVTTSLNVIITEQPGIIHEPETGLLDERRVSVLNAVTTRRAAPITLPHGSNA